MNRSFILGVFVGFLLMGCAGATFAYNYYGLQAASYDGKLLAINQANDMDLSTCAPTPTTTGQCVVMLGPDFYSLKQDYLDCQNNLIACQKSCTQ